MLKLANIVLILINSSPRNVNIYTLQSLTGKYREIQGKPCNENRDPAMRTGFPCNESRFFPVGIDLQGFPVSYTGFGFAVYTQILALVKNQTSMVCSSRKTKIPLIKY